jgi:uncharacterized repeat protein (TIGR03809 family)
MTHRFDVAHDPAVVARWCTLAEQRLDYLTELFQNGRWRRYYSHTAFLENIKEAKAMVAHWRALSTPGYVPEQRTPILIPDLKVPELKAASVPEVVEAAPDEIHVDVASQAAPVDEAASAPAPEVVDTLPSTADHFNDRYSLLRNLTL